MGHFAIPGMPCSFCRTPCRYPHCSRRTSSGVPFFFGLRVSFAESVTIYLNWVYVSVAVPGSGPWDVRLFVYWRRFKIRRQASTPGDSEGRATDTRYQRPYSHTSSARTQLFSARCSIYGRPSTREDKLSRWLVSSSESFSYTIIWCCFPAGANAVMLRSEEKA